MIYVDGDIGAKKLKTFETGDIEEITEDPNSVDIRVYFWKDELKTEKYICSV